MFLTAAIIFIAAFGSAGATNTVAAPVILEGAVQQVDVESHEADLRLRGSIPLPQDAAAAQDDVYADGLSTSTSFYLSVASQTYACSDDCYHVELKQRDYKEANPSKCQWQMGGSDSILNVGCSKVMDVSGNRCKNGQGIILYTHNASRNQKWTGRQHSSTIWFQTKGIWCNKALVAIREGIKLTLTLGSITSSDRWFVQEFLWKTKIVA